MAPQNRTIFDLQSSPPNRDLYYWKKSYPWLGDEGKWTKCEWTLSPREQNGGGILRWDTAYKRGKGMLNIRDHYHLISIQYMDEKEFFNGVPSGVPMVPYVLVVPMTKVNNSAGGAGYRQYYYFALSSLEQLSKWLTAFAIVLEAEDSLREMFRRVRKDNGAATVAKGQVLIEVWRRFVEAISVIDHRRNTDQDRRDEDEQNQQRVNFLWTMAVVAAGSTNTGAVII